MLIFEGITKYRRIYLVQLAPALFSQLLPRLNRRPLGFHDALASFVPPTEPIGRNPEAAHLRARWDEPRAAAPPQSIRPPQPGYIEQLLRVT
jgi:hypothetical protein